MSPGARQRIFGLVGLLAFQGAGLLRRHATSPVGKDHSKSITICRTTPQIVASLSIGSIG